jgi:arylformamidase
MRHLDKIRCPVIVAHGDRETPEFQRQNREFAAALQKIGKLARFVVVPGHNHFEMARSLARADGLLGGAMLELMGLKR